MVYLTTLSVGHNLILYIKIYVKYDKQEVGNSQNVEGSDIISGNIHKFFTQTEKDKESSQ